MLIETVTITPDADVIASVRCHDFVYLTEEKKIRAILDNFYTKKTPRFARFAMRIAGTMILFRATDNHHKPRPTGDDIMEVLKAINCYPPDEMPKRSHKKQPSMATCRTLVA